MMPQGAANLNGLSCLRSVVCEEMPFRLGCQAGSGKPRALLIQFPASFPLTPACSLSQSRVSGQSNLSPGAGGEAMFGANVLAGIATPRLGTDQDGPPRDVPDTRTVGTSSPP